MSVSTDLCPYPALIRPFVYPWLDSVKRLQGHVRSARQALRLVFTARTAATTSESKEERYLDMAQWMVESARGSDRDSDILVLKMLFLTLASVHISSMTVTHALFDLFAMPEYVQPLREELREVVVQYGWTREGIYNLQYGWTREGIYNLRRLDSFLKETQRITHPGLCKIQCFTWQRS